MKNIAAYLSAPKRSNCFQVLELLRVLRYQLRNIWNMLQIFAYLFTCLIVEEPASQKKTLLGVRLLCAIGNTISKYSSRSLQTCQLDSQRKPHYVCAIYLQLSNFLDPRPRDLRIQQICNNVHQRQQAQASSSLGER